MAEADLDVVIRQLAKQQNKGLMAAVKSRRKRYIGLADKAKDKETKERYKQIAKNIMLQGAAAANPLHFTNSSSLRPVQLIPDRQRFRPSCERRLRPSRHG